MFVDYNWFDPKGISKSAKSYKLVEKYFAKYKVWFRVCGQPNWSSLNTKWFGYDT